MEENKEKEIKKRKKVFVIVVIFIFLSVVALWILYMYVNGISFNINFNSEKINEGKSIISKSWSEISKMFGFLKEKGGDLLNEIQKNEETSTTTEIIATTTEQ